MISIMRNVVMILAPVNVTEKEWQYGGARCLDVQERTINLKFSTTWFLHRIKKRPMDQFSLPPHYRRRSENESISLFARNWANIKSTSFSTLLNIKRRPSPSTCDRITWSGRGFLSSVHPVDQSERRNYDMKPLSRVSRRFSAMSIWFSKSWNRYWTHFNTSNRMCTTMWKIFYAHAPDHLVGKFPLQLSRSRGTFRRLLLSERTVRS